MLETVLTKVVELLRRGSHGVVYSFDDASLCQLLRDLGQQRLIVLIDPTGLFARNSLERGFILSDVRAVPLLPEEAVVCFALASSFSSEEKQHVSQLLPELRNPVLFLERKIFRHRRFGMFESWKTAPTIDWDLAFELNLDSGQIRHDHAYFLRS